MHDLFRSATLTLFIATAPVARAETAPTKCQSWLGSRLILIHPIEFVRRALRRPAARTAWNQRQLRFEPVGGAKADDKAHVPHAKLEALRERAEEFGWVLYVVQNSRRYLYARGRGVVQIPLGWVVLVNPEDFIVEEIRDPAGIVATPPQDHHFLAVY